MEKPTIYSFSQIAPLIVEQYERYLPTAYNEQLTLLEKVNLIIKHLDTIGQATNGLVEQWNLVMEWVLTDGITADVNARLDQMVADGTMDTIINENIFASLNAEIDLKADQTKLNQVMNNPTNYTGAVVTFIDDDISSNFKATWDSILQSKGINISLACLTGNVGQAGSLTKQELLNYQTSGNDILSHGVSGMDHGYATSNDADYDFQTAQQWLKDNGFKGYEFLVYSGGLERDNARIKNLARRYYKYGVGAWYWNNTPYNDMPVDNWCLARVNGDSSDLATLKSALDQAIANDGWLIVMTHSHLMTGDSVTKITDFITYAQSMNVPIQPLSKAIELKGNAVAVGEYIDESSTFISVKGTPKSGLLVDSSPANNLMNDPVSKYKKDCVTVRLIDTGHDVAFNTGGVLETFRNANADIYSFQTFKLYSKNEVHMRSCDGTTWGAWEKISTGAIIQEGLELLGGNTGNLVVALHPDGLKSLKGTIVKSADTGSIATIPSGYRPTETAIGNTWNNTTTPNVRVGSVMLGVSGSLFQNNLGVAGDTIHINMTWR